MTSTIKLTAEANSRRQRPMVREPSTAIHQSDPYRAPHFGSAHH